MATATQWIVLSLVVAAGLAGIIILWRRGQAAIAERDRLAERFKAVLDAEAEAARVRLQSESEMASTR